MCNAEGTKNIRRRGVASLHKPRSTIIRCCANDDTITLSSGQTIVLSKSGAAKSSFAAAYFIKRAMRISRWISKSGVSQDTKVSESGTPS